MNNAFLFAAFALIALPEQGRSQTPTDQKPVLPSGPLVVTQMPDKSQWVVDYTYSDAAKPGQPSTLDLYKKEALTNPGLAKELENPQYALSLLNPRPLQVVYTKTGNIRHEMRTYEFGYNGELWADDTICVERKFGVPGLIATIPDAASPNTFPEMAWIGRDNFVGVQLYDDVKCFEFTQNVYDYQHHLVGPKSAYINASTLYPVGFTYHTETRKYTYPAAPTEDLVIPDDFLSAGKAMVTAIQRGTPHLAHP